MAYEYLKELSLTDEQVAKLRSLGARSPSALLAMMEQAPEKFARFVGEQESQRIRTLLQTLVPEEEKNQLAELPPFQGKFGARVVPRDPPASAVAATRRRDELARRIQMIRESGASSGKAKALLEDLEKAFREEVKSSVTGGD